MKNLNITICEDEASIEEAVSVMPNDGDIVAYVNKDGKLIPLYQCMKRYSDEWIPCSHDSIDTIASNLADTVLVA